MAIENFVEGQKKMNALRRLSLPDIPVRWHNCSSERATLAKQNFINQRDRAILIFRFERCGQRHPQ